MGVVRLLELYGLPAATAIFGVAAAGLAVTSGPAAAAVAVAGAIGTATIDVVLRFRAEAARHAGEAAALAHVGSAARRFRDRLAAELPLGGTGVPEQPDRVASFAEWIRGGRFDFLQGRRWSDWEKVGLLVERGCSDITAAAALVGDRLPPTEEQRIRELRELGESATRHAFEIASAYAGYTVGEEPRGSRYGPASDQPIDATQMEAYATFGVEFTALVAELDRLSSGSGG
jgi:hypothetical protein